MRTHWISLLLLLLLLLRGATEVEGEHQEPETPGLNSLDASSSLPRITEDVYSGIAGGSVGADAEGAEAVRRYECPAGFFRLRRSCYYLSAGTAPWREAYFQCAARNSSLAVLNRNGKDKILRKYLTGDQFRPLERWIGGLYNWHKMHWEWGGSGDKVLFQNFADRPGPVGDDAKSFAHHCIVLDPEREYKWNARDCVEHKFYICEVSAGRINKSRRRRKNIVAAPNAPQNQRLRAPKGTADRAVLGRGIRLDPSHRRGRKNKLRSMRKRNWHLRLDDNQVWAHGIKLGSRPPKSSLRMTLKGPRPVAKSKIKEELREKKPARSETVTQVTPSSKQFGAFPADGRAKPDEYLQSLSNEEVIFPRIFAPGKDFTREEVLLKL